MATAPDGPARSSNCLVRTLKKASSTESVGTTGRRGAISGPLKITSDSSKAKKTQDVQQAFPVISSQPSFISVDSGEYRWYLSKVIYSEGCEFIIGIVLIFNFILIVNDTDMRASNKQTSPIIAICSDICLFIYVVELGARVAVEKSYVVRTAWNNLDILVVASGLLEKCIELTGHRMNTSTGFTMLRTVRILRLLRAVRIMAAVRELRKLIQMMMLCLRTLFWSLVLAFLLMTIWSVLMVELVHPHVQELELAHGVWKGNEAWTMAFSSVMRANLTLFQTIVAGDSWGSLSVPIIEAHPWTAMIFVPAHVTLVFGVLNLIVVVLVDTFAEVRERDVKSRLAEKELHEREEKKDLLKIFHAIDTDGSGSLTLDELEAAARYDPELSARLRVMDVGKDDLQRLFSILDDDGSGDVDPEEFMDVMYRLKNSDSQASIIFMKHLLLDLGRRLEKNESSMEGLKSSVQRVRQNMARRDDLDQQDGASTPVSEDAAVPFKPRRNSQMSCASYSSDGCASYESYPWTGLQQRPADDDRSQGLSDTTPRFLTLAQDLRDAVEEVLTSELKPAGFADGVYEDATTPLGSERPQYFVDCRPVIEQVDGLQQREPGRPANPEFSSEKSLGKSWLV